MPFSTDTNWPPGLLNFFTISREQPGIPEPRYYGPYDRLLNYALIEGSFAFTLAVKAERDVTFVGDGVDFQNFMVSNQEQKPVLIVEIQGDWADEAYIRQNADTRMRQRYNEMLYDCPIHHLYGLSLLGTSLCVYCGDKVTGQITLHFVDKPYEDRLLPSNFLKEQWELDILSPDGSKKMQEIVAFIKAEAANAIVGQ